MKSGLMKTPRLGLFSPWLMIIPSLVILMQEHFNENFMESDKYPKSKFNGKIENFKPDMLKGPVTNVTVTGQLTVHGVEKTITVPATLGLENGKLVATSKFNVTPEDYGITIPALVRDKIARQMEITIKANYVSMDK